MRIRRKALAMEASMPTSEKQQSNCSFLWNWTCRFWGDVTLAEGGLCASVRIRSYLFEVPQTPLVVFAWVVTGEVGRGYMRDGFCVDANDLFDTE